jgi:hypothetical protein
MKRFLLSVTLLLSLWAWGQEEAPQVSRLQDWGGFFSIGYEGGSIAPYGIRAESARVDRWIGGFLIARTSFHSRQKLEQVSREDFPANKTEFIGGVNFRLIYWAYLNIGGGIGQHYYPFENGYNHQRSLEKKTYLPGYLGATFRLIPRWNLIGGMSFIAITEKLYAPEYTLGITYNLKRNK